MTEFQRQRKLKECRLAREEAMERSIQIWEKEVLPDWQKAVKDPRIRKLWRSGIPPKLRAQLWEGSVGNSLALSKGMQLSFLVKNERLELRCKTHIEHAFLVPGDHCRRALFRARSSSQLKWI